MSEIRDRLKKTTITCDRHGAVETLVGWPSCSQCNEERRAVQDAAEKAAERRDRVDAAIRSSGLVGRFAIATLDSFEAPDRKCLAALNAARDFADSVTAPAWRTLWLLGSPGAGKTHLASGIVRRVIEQHYPLTAAIRTVGEIVAEHRALWDQHLRDERRTYNSTFARGGGGWLPTTTDELTSWFGSRSLLAIDDVGATRLGDAELEILFNVVDLRYRACKPTVITSNLPVKEFAAHVGARLSDRLLENAAIVSCAWPSRRQGPMNRRSG